MGFNIVFYLSFAATPCRYVTQLTFFTLAQVIVNLPMAAADTAGGTADAAEEPLLPGRADVG